MRIVPIALADNTISSHELTSLAEWLQSGDQLTKGPLTREFEADLAQYIGTSYCVMVNSGSSANLLMAYSLLENGSLRNKKVIVPSVCWITTISPFLQLGFQCLLCDSDAHNLGVDLNHLESLLREHSPALLVVVHVLGHPNMMDEIRSLCEAYDCIVIEDACEALGTRYRGKMTGNLSLAGSFSFYYGHHMSTIEGGAVSTDDTKLYTTMLSIRSHGWSRDVPDDQKNAWREKYSIDEFREFYSFYYPGFNLRSSDLNAYIGIRQLRKMKCIVELREHNFRRYCSRLNGFWCQTSDCDQLSSFAYGTFVANRLEVFRQLRAAGIESRPLVCGSMGRQPFWIERYGETRLTVADRVHDNGIYLPNHAGLTDAMIDRVCDEFLSVARPMDLGSV